MVKQIQCKPDYEYWCKFDSWSLKNTALLLHGIEPLSCSDIRFNTKETPGIPSLKEAHKTFLLLKNVIKDGRQLAYNSALHPYEVCTIATDRNIQVPEELTKHIRLRYEQEQNKNGKNPLTFAPPKKDTPATDKELSTRERRALLKSIGIMTILLMEDANYSSEFKLNDRPNAARITEAVLTKAQMLGVSVEGIKILERKIKEALLLLIDEEI